MRVLPTRPAAPLLVAALLLAGALVACSSDTVSDPTGDPNGSAPTSGPLDGATYLAVSATEGDAARPFVEGSEVRLTFGGGRLGIQAGCNTMSGGYTVDGDQLHVTSMASTEMACEEPLMDQDAWLADFFAAPVTLIQEDDTLRLSTADAALELVDAEVAAGETALTDTDWQLASILAGAGDDGTASSVPDGVTATLRINGDGSVEVNTGCNSGFTTAEVTATSIRFGPLGLTRKACPDDAANQVERAVVAIFDGEVEFEIAENQLTTTRDDSGLQWTVQP